MSTHDSHSDPPAPAPGARRGPDEEPAVATRRRPSPALRLAAWMFALVLLLVLLGWALDGIL
jgi:hypothetical protein